MFDTFIGSCYSLRMTSDDALRIIREAGPAIEELPIDDDRVPGLARALASAALVMDAAMRAGDIPLDWALPQGDHHG